MRPVGGPASTASSRRLPAAPAPQSGSTRQFQRGGGAPPPGPGGKKDNTPMIVGGVAAGLLVLVGLGFAMMGGKEPPKKKEAPKAAPKVAEPAPPAYNPWDDPKMMGSETDAAKRRKAGLNDQNKSGEVDRTKVGTDGK